MGNSGQNKHTRNPKLTKGMIHMHTKTNRSLFSVCKERFNTFKKSKFVFIAEKFIITGPVLIGWILGILRHEPATAYFKLGIQSMMLFFIYLTTRFVLYLAHILIDYPVFIHHYLESAAALAYLVICLRVFALFLKGEARVHHRVHTFVDRLSGTTAVNPE